MVRFPNSVCAGDAFNGTCYTSEECNDRGGTSSGTCANGYGVCCICKCNKIQKITDNSFNPKKVGGGRVGDPDRSNFDRLSLGHGQKLGLSNLQVILILGVSSHSKIKFGCYNCQIK